jgi:hypothetical protein
MKTFQDFISELLFIASNYDWGKPAMVRYHFDEWDFLKTQIN